MRYGFHGTLLLVEFTRDQADHWAGNGPGHARLTTKFNGGMFLNYNRSPPTARCNAVLAGSRIHHLYIS
ncbi:hypothetical protein QUB80_29930 [Chlorogloeopsis sp. ULAP01]|uniref:hypothetical protein n=1 Tax=Chlorogloeopsis sp. ULAP01 TaxID=3056483 RepID=UPI0025AAD7DA|nr:hypothetical protein [Chlorogloeopsis sp. ULAP01]MDM9384881.1 hypothetical protein [Chlorogloeopsis sp. ULAP01]